MAPNMLPWSVSAIAGMPASTAALITSSRRLAPSRRLNWLWRWRWTKSDIAVESVVRSPPGMLPESEPSSPLPSSQVRALFPLPLDPARLDDVVEPRGQGEGGHQIDGGE